MKRKSIFWASVSLAIILSHSCRLPSAVEINVDDFELSLRLSAETSFSAMFMDILEDAFGGMDTPVRVFDMVDEGPAMTFLAAFELGDMLPSFNPSDYLADFADYDADGISPIVFNIPVPDLSWSPDGIEIPLSELVPGIPPNALAGTRQVVPLPQQVVEAISAASDAWALSGGFLEADVGSGTFGLRATVLTAGSSQPLNVRGQITVSQDPASLKDGSGSFNGLGASESWKFTEWSPHDLHGSSLNRNPIIVHPGISESFLDIEFGNVSLWGDSTIRIEMELAIGSFELVRLDPHENEDLEIPSIDVNFAALHSHRMSIADFVQEITFSETEMSFNFYRLHDALDENVRLAITSERLGFGREETPPLLTRGITFTGSSVTLDFTDDVEWVPGDDEDEYEAIVDIVVELVPVNGKYFEFGPISLDSNGYLDVHATVALDFEWYSAKIDIDLVDEDLLSGSILDEPINLEDTLGDLISGFAFADDSIGIRVFLDGAPGILDTINPTITLNAVFDEHGVDRVPLLEIRELTTDTIPELPKDTNVWTSQNDHLLAGGTEADMDAFIEIIGDGLPEHLRFYYEVTFNDRIITIYHRDMLDDGNNDDGDVRVMIMMKLALDFEVSDNASLNLPLFEDSEDIFGRDRLGDPLFGDDSIDLRMLMLRLDFDNSIFQGAVLHLDANRNLFPNGLALDDGTGNLEVRITGNDFDIINRHLIPPDVRISFLPTREENLTITRNLMPTRITIAVSGSYRLEL